MRQKGVEMTTCRGGVGTSQLASACCSVSQNTAVLLRRQKFLTKFRTKVLQQCSFSLAEQLGNGDWPSRQ